MNKQQAEQLLREVLSGLKLTRKEHEVLEQALQTLLSTPQQGN